MLDIYYEQLDEMWIPVEAVARLAWSESWNTPKTKSGGRSGRPALDYLAANFPTEYAKEVNEVHGDRPPPTAGPIAPTLTAPREV